MSPSEWLMFAATLAWYQAMETRHLGLYASAVMLTFVLKWIWERWL